MEPSLTPTSKKIGPMMRRRIDHPWREVEIVVTPICSGNCCFCFLEKSVVGDCDWENLYVHVIRGLAMYDHVQNPVTVRIYGGELFMDRHVENPEFRFGLEKLITIVKKFVTRDGCVDFPISIENVSDRGIDYANELIEKFGISVLVPFSIERIRKEAKEDRYWRNIARLKKIKHIGILMVDTESGHEKYREKLLQYSKDIGWEEPVMLNGFHFSYKDISVAPCADVPRCVSHYMRAITSKGIFTCAGYTRKPDWISDEEWEKLKTDENYLIEGYQQVIDWYGCDDCERAETCPGMCWKTAYAQKFLYKNRKCLYRDNTDHIKEAV